MTSADLFAAIADHVARHPELVTKVATVFQFKLAEPASAYTLDVKNGAGGLTPGVADKADVTLEMSDANFVGMATGKIDAQKLYFGGQLKISGNVMASQKLGFLKDIDPNDVMAAAKKRRGRRRGRRIGIGPAATREGAKRRPSTRPCKAAERPTAIFEALGKRLAENPSLAKEVDAVVVFKITNPDETWRVDLKKNELKRGGETKDADVTLTLSDEDLEVLASSDGRGEPAAPLSSWRQGPAWTATCASSPTRLGSSLEAGLG